MTKKILTSKGAPQAIGLHGLIEEFNLKIGAKFPGIVSSPGAITRDREATRANGSPTKRTSALLSAPEPQPWP
jgi:hypothetical protein